MPFGHEYEPAEVAETPSRFIDDALDTALRPQSDVGEPFGMTVQGSKPAEEASADEPVDVPDAEDDLAPEAFRGVILDPRHYPIQRGQV